MQIERLSELLDEQDLDALDTVSQRLQMTANKYGAHAISEKASELQSILNDDRDPHSILQVANELLDLCRSTQQSFLDANPAAAAAAEGRSA